MKRKKAGGPAPKSSADLNSSEGMSVSQRKRVRGDLGLSWILITLLVVGGLTYGAVYLQADAIAQRLTDEARSTLRAAGISGVGVNVEGRNLVATVPTGANSEQVVSLLSNIDGVNAVSFVQAYANKAEAKACAGIEVALRRATDKQSIGFAGTSASLTAQGTSQVKAAAKLLRACPPAQVVVGGHTDPSTKQGASLTLKRAQAIASILIDEGVARQRIRALGYADQFPLDNDPGRKANQVNERGSIEIVGA